MFNPRVKINNPTTLIMCKAAQKAARKLIRDFGEVEQLQISQKGPKDFVTNADRKAEQVIREELEKGRPDFSFLMEESGAIVGKDTRQRWIVDPLDGTMNFLHGLPYFCISIAYEKDDEILAGVVYDPIRDEMFCAEKGYGAFMNEQRLRVSARRNIGEALMGVSAAPGHRSTMIDKTLKAFETEVAAMRWFGASALDLCYVAAGRLDAYIGLGLAPWDMAAGGFIIREAGGYTTTLDGKKFDLTSENIVASNSYLSDKMLKLIR